VASSKQTSWLHSLWLLTTSFSLTAALLVFAPSAFPVEVTYPGRPGLIAYYRQAPPCRADGEGGMQCHHGIWTAQLDGSGERRLTDPKQEVGRPAWSRDGRRIAYLAGTGLRGSFELWVMNADGGGKRRLRIAAPFGYFPESIVPSWSPDAKELVVAGTRHDSSEPGAPPTPVVLAVPANGRRPRVLFSLPRAKNRLAYVSNPQLSPNGRLIAFIYGRGGLGESLYVARPDGSARRFLSRAFSEPGRNLDWSPDGRRIAFYRQVNPASGGYAELYVINANGSGLRRLTARELGSENMYLSWSPDGTRILFSSGAAEFSIPFETDGIRFALINADGSGLRVIGPAVETCLVAGSQFINPYGGCGASDPAWQPR
jgi:Tol biopolymer transport system component